MKQDRFNIKKLRKNVSLQIIFQVKYETIIIVLKWV